MKYNCVKYKNNKFNWIFNMSSKIERCSNDLNTIKP